MRREELLGPGVLVAIGTALSVCAYWLADRFFGLPVVRRRALELVREVVPSDTGDGRFDVVVKDYGGRGTTCGYLVHWLLWRLGKRQAVNRGEPAAGLRYVPGANISMVDQNPAFHRYHEGSPERPKPGDIYFQSDGPPDTEHVGVVMAWPDDEHVLTADAGQRNAAGSQAARFVRRQFREGRLPRLDHIGEPRRLVGWIDIEKAT